MMPNRIMQPESFRRDSTAGASEGKVETTMNLAPDRPARRQPGPFGAHRLRTGGVGTPSESSDAPGGEDLREGLVDAAPPSRAGEVLTRREFGRRLELAGPPPGQAPV